MIAIQHQWESLHLPKIFVGIFFRLFVIINSLPLTAVKFIAFVTVLTLLPVVVLLIQIKRNKI